MLLDFYAVPGGSAIDVTANRRRMWRGVRWDGRVTYFDIDPMMKPDVVADFSALPVEPMSIDVIVFDPPHLPAAGGSVASSPQMRTNYGLAASLQADNTASYFAPFLTESVRVLRPGGLIFAKLKDYVHNHRYQWMLVAWINAVWDVPGLTPCDLIVKQDPCGGNLKSGRWQRAYHVRNAHCWWVVVRKGKCEPSGVPRCRENTP